MRLKKLHDLLRQEGVKHISANAIELLAQIEGSAMLSKAEKQNMMGLWLSAYVVGYDEGWDEGNTSIREK